MKKIVKNISVLALTVVLAAGGTWSMAFAGTDPHGAAAGKNEIVIEIPEENALKPGLIPEKEQKEKLQQSEEQQTVKGLSDPFDYTGKKARNKLLLQAESFPEKYDLRNADIDGDGIGDGRCFVTPVKLQNPFGTCWGFAAVAAAESSILSSLLKDDPDAYKTFDLSEKQLAYFSHMPLDLPGFSQDGEGTYSDTSSADGIYVGGLPFLATSTFAAGIGPVREEHDPEAPKYYPELEYRGSNSYTDQRAVDGEYIDFSYSAEDDWFIDESFRFLQHYVLKESYMLPSPAGRNAKTREYEYNEAGTAAIKDQLMENRAVEIGFAADTSSPNQETGDGKYISRNWAHYTWDKNAQSNHAVTIIGYDDNYPKENFVEGHQPEKDGAWLVKNSWGSGEVEFPNCGTGDWGILVPKLDEEGNEVIENGEKVMVHSGYFWLSYYDMSLSLPEALSFDEVNQDSYYLDENDLMPVSDVEAVTSKEPLKMANVFQGEVCEELYAVSCQTGAPNTKVSFDVYLLPDEFQSPEDGIPVGHEEAVYEYGGYHKIALSKPLQIQKGQYYSVIVTQILDNNEYFMNMPTGFGPRFDPSSYQVGIINERESFAYIDGEWKDYSEDSVRREIYPEPYMIDRYDVVFDNFPIKVYATPLTTDISMRFVGESEMILYEGCDSTKLKLRFTGEGGHPMGRPEISWKLAEGGEKIVTMTPSADNTYADLTAVGAGRTFVCITVEGVGTSVVPVTVTSVKPVYIIYQEPDYTTYTGKAFTPAVSVYSAEKLILKEGEHYTLSYKDNVKVGVGSVTATSTIDEKDSVTAPLNITPAKAAVTGLKTGKKKLTVTVKDQKASGITGYKIQYRVKGTSKWKSKKLKAGKTKLTVTGLKTGKKYEVRACGYYNVPKEKQEEGYVPVFYGDYSKVKTSGKIK